MSTIFLQLLYEPAAMVQALAAGTGLAEYPNGELLHATLESTFLLEHAPVRGAIFDITMRRQFRGVPNLARALATVKAQDPIRYGQEIDRISPQLTDNLLSRKKEGERFDEIVPGQINVAYQPLWDLAELHRIFLLMNEEDQLLALVRPPQAENGNVLYVGRQLGDLRIYISDKQFSLEHGPLDLVIDGGTDLDLVLHRRSNEGNVSVQRPLGIESAPSLVLEDNDRFLIGGGFYLKLIALHDAAEEVPAEETRIGTAPIDDSLEPAPTLEPTPKMRAETDGEISGAILYNDRDRFSVDLANRKKVIIGRNGTIRIENPSVSRQHAHLRRVGNTIIIKDLDSSNGTYVNGHGIEGVYTLHPGDKIRFGSVEFVFDFKKSPEQEPTMPPVSVAKIAVVSPTPPPPPRSRWRRLLGLFNRGSGD